MTEVGSQSWPYAHHSDSAQLVRQLLNLPTPTLNYPLGPRCPSLRPAYDRRHSARHREPQPLKKEGKKKKKSSDSPLPVPPALRPARRRRSHRVPKSRPAVPARLPSTLGEAKGPGWGGARRGGWCEWVAGWDASGSAPGSGPCELTRGGFGTAAPGGFRLRAEHRALKSARPGSPSFSPSVCQRHSANGGVPAPAAFAFASLDRARVSGRAATSRGRATPAARGSPVPSRAHTGRAPPLRELLALSSGYSGAENSCKVF